jgi:hypothetical protein
MEEASENQMERERGEILELQRTFKATKVPVTGSRISRRKINYLSLANRSKLLDLQKLRSKIKQSSSEKIKYHTFLLL